MNEEIVVSYLKRSRVTRGLRAHSWFLLLILLPVANKNALGQNLSVAGQSSEEHLSVVDDSTELRPPVDSRRAIPVAAISKDDDRPRGDESSSTSGATGVVLAKPAAPPETFHFWPAMLQSLEFTLTSDVFRVATDSGLQYNLEHLPYFHDWFVSYDGYNLHRW